MERERNKKNPNRDNLGPTGPMKMPPDSREHHTYDEEHPNPGCVGEETPVVQPTTAPRGRPDEPSPSRRRDETSK